MTGRHNERVVKLAHALAPHQARYDRLDDAYRRRQALMISLAQIDEEIRLLTVELYDGMTVQVIRSEISR